MLLLRYVNITEKGHVAFLSTFKMRLPLIGRTKPASTNHRQGYIACFQKNNMFTTLTTVSATLGNENKTPLSTNHSKDEELANDALQ